MKRAPFVAIRLFGHFSWRLWWTWLRFHFGFQEVKSNLTRHLDQPQEGQEIPEIKRYLLAFQRARKYSLAPKNCLRECYCLLEVLKSKGMCPTLRIGVKKKGQLAAHAWLEWQGQQLASDSLDYHPLEKS